MANRPNLPREFPTLPSRPDSAAWSPNVQTAHGLLLDTYHRAHAVLRQEADSVRLRYHIDTLLNDTLPVLEAMEEDAQQEGLSRNWLHSAAEALGLLVTHLQTAADSAEDR